MDVNTIVQLINGIGFPIACCIALYYQQNKTMKEFSEKMDSNIKELSDSIEKNTNATVRLVTTVETLSKIGGADNG